MNLSQNGTTGKVLKESLHFVPLSAQHIPRHIPIDEVRAVAARPNLLNMNPSLPLSHLIEVI